MDIKKLNPWNGFKHEERRERSNVPVLRRTAPAPAADSPLLSLHQQIDRLFDDAIRSFGLPARGRDGPLSLLHASLLRPRLDIDATGSEYRVTVEIPGVDQQEVRLEPGPDDRLRISGKKRQEREERQRDVYRVEPAYGAFERVLSLPEDVDPDAIKASFHNGVLTVRLPREAGAHRHGRRIPIETAESTPRRLAA